MKNGLSFGSYKYEYISCERNVEKEFCGCSRIKLLRLVVNRIPLKYGIVNWVVVYSWLGDCLGLSHCQSQISINAIKLASVCMFCGFWGRHFVYSKLLRIWNATTRTTTTHPNQIPPQRAVMCYFSLEPFQRRSPILDISLSWNTFTYAYKPMHRVLNRNSKNEKKMK